MRDDLYSMLFVSTLHAEYILHCQRDQEDAELAREKLLEEYRRERKRENKIQDAEEEP